MKAYACIGSKNHMHVQAAMIRRLYIPSYILLHLICGKVKIVHLSYLR